MVMADQISQFINRSHNQLSWRWSYEAPRERSLGSSKASAFCRPTAVCEQPQFNQGA